MSGQFKQLYAKQMVYCFFVQQLQEQVMNAELSQTQLRKKNNQLKEESLEVILVTVYDNVRRYYFLLCGQVSKLLFGGCLTWTTKQCYNILEQVLNLQIISTYGYIIISTKKGNEKQYTVVWEIFSIRKLSSMNLTNEN